MELKTLKDMDKCIDIEGVQIEGSVYIRQLKAEAVKWVKFEREEFGSRTFDTQDWIIQFFNLTEEDLNEK